MRRVSDKIAIVQGSPAFFCPGCKGLHIAEGIKWNNNPLYPTFSGSIEREGCSVKIESGHMRFSDNSKHLYVGKYVEMPVLPEWVK